MLRYTLGKNHHQFFDTHWEITITGGNLLTKRSLTIDGMWQIGGDIGLAMLGRSTSNTGMCIIMIRVIFWMTRDGTATRATYRHSTL